jgi:hypothetical protein
MPASGELAIRLYLPGVGSSLLDYQPPIQPAVGPGESNTRSRLFLSLRRLPRQLSGESCGSDFETSQIRQAIQPSGQDAAKGLCFRG